MIIKAHRSSISGLLVDWPRQKILSSTRGKVDPQPLRLWHAPLLTGCATNCGTTTLAGVCDPGEDTLRMEGFEQYCASTLQQYLLKAERDPVTCIASNR